MSEELIIEVVGIFAGAGVRKDESVIICQHKMVIWASFERYVQNAGIDVPRMTVRWPAGGC